MFSDQCFYANEPPPLRARMVHEHTVCKHVTCNVFPRLYLIKVHETATPLSIFMHTLCYVLVLSFMYTEKQLMFQLLLTKLWNSPSSQRQPMSKPLQLVHTVFSHTVIQTSFRLLVMRPTM